MLLGRKVHTLPRRVSWGQPNYRDQLKRRREQHLNLNARFLRPTSSRIFATGDLVLVQDERAKPWQPATINEEHPSPASSIVQPEPARVVSPLKTDNGGGGGGEASEGETCTLSARPSTPQPLRRTAQMIRSDPVRTRSGRVSRPPERLQDQQQESDVLHCDRNVLFDTLMFVLS